MFIKHSNAISTVTLALFAAYGIIVLVSGILRRDTGNRAERRARKVAGKSTAGLFLRAFCVASFVAFTLEATVFNFQHYLKYFADGELATTTVSPKDPNRVMTSDSGYSVLSVKATDTTVGSAGLLFKDLNRRVTSILADIQFTGGNMADMTVQWTDEESTREYKKKIYKDMPHENYAPLQPCGKVSELMVLFSGVDKDTKLKIVSITLNKQIPFYFSGLRLIVASLLIFVVLVAFNKESRAKASYYLFEYRFNPASKKQALVYVCTVVMLILFSWICVSTSVGKEQPVNWQYNRFLVDALLKGKTYLEYGHPEKLLKAERPYDTRWLTANGYKRDVDWMWDWVWYKGKHYSYFGVVPAVILFVPYKMITGNYLSNSAGVFLLVSATIVLLAALWRHCVRKYMPDAKFVFYLMSFLALFFASGQFVVLRLPSAYTIVQSAGLMFAVAGIYLLLKSAEKERVGRVKLFFACLCFALIAGCRPSVAIVSLLVPVVLWKRGLRNLLPVIIIPFVLVAIPLCAYNYIRFGSIFDFGVNYQLTSINVAAYDMMNPLAKLIRLLMASVKYLFTPSAYTLTFPFVNHLSRAPWIVHGSIQYSDSGVGIVCFPVVFCLLWLLFGKEKPKAFPLLSALLIAAAATILLNSLVMGFVGRYAVDFATFIILPSIFCAYYWACNGSRRLGMVYALLAVSVFTGLFLFVNGASAHPYEDPVLYRYLEYSLGFIRNI